MAFKPVLAHASCVFDSSSLEFVRYINSVIINSVIIAGFGEIGEMKSHKLSNF